MASFTSTRELNISWRGTGLEFVGAAGTVFDLPDEFVDTFNREIASSIPGLKWVEVNARGYGVVGDGTTDDTTALRSLIAAAGGARIDLTGLNCKISGALTVSADGTHFYGPATITQTSTSTCLFIVTADDVRFQGLTLVQTGTGQGSLGADPTPYGAAVAFKLCRNGTVRDCKISAPNDVGGTGGALIYLSGTSGCLIDGNTIIGGGYDAINSDAFYGLTGGNIISGNYISAPYRDGYCGDFQGANVNSNVADLVTGNYIESPGDRGIEVGAALNGWQITDNKINGGLIGIAVVASAKGAIHGNIIAGPGTGIVANTNGSYVISELDVAGNVIRDCGGDGIQLYTVRNSSFHDNAIISNDWNGIRTIAGQYPEQLRIESNSIRLNGRHGIYLPESFEMIVAHNVILSNGQSVTNTYDGLRIEGSPQDVKVVANIFGSFDTQAYPNNHKYSVNYTPATGTDIVLRDNDLTGCVTAELATGFAGILRSGNAPATVSNSTGQGATFPTVAVQTGDRYFRTDLNLEFVWDGNRWASSTLYRLDLTGGATAFEALSATGFFLAASPGIHSNGVSAVCTELSIGCNASSLSSTAYWGFDLSRLYAGGSTASIVTDLNSADTNGQYTTHEKVLTYVIGPASGPVLKFTCTKNGSPGNLTVAACLYYRLTTT